MSTRNGLSAVAATLISALLFTACSSSPEATAVNPNVTPPSGDSSTELQVNFGDDVPAGHYILSGARQRVELDQDEDTTLAFELDTPALLSAVDEQTGTTLTAISMPISDLDSVPVTIDWTSTAFASWVTTADWVTSDAGVMLILRLLAENSPHLAELATALAAGDTSSADEARTALSGDVIAALATGTPAQNGASTPTAPDSGDTTDATGSATASASTAVVTTVAYRPGGDTETAANVRQVADVRQAADEDAACLDASAEALGVCITANDTQPKTGASLKMTSTAPTWVALYAVDGTDITGRPLALVEPVTYGGITVTSLIQDLGKSLWGALGTGVCSVVKFFGSKCSDKEKKANEDNLRKLIEQSWQTAGEATVRVNELEGAAPVTTLVTAGRAPGGQALAGTHLDGAQALITILDGWSYLIEPSIKLVLGVKDLNEKSKGNVPSDSKDSNPTPSGESSDPEDDDGQGEMDEALAELVAVIEAASGLTGLTSLFDLRPEASLSDQVTAGVSIITSIGTAIVNDGGLRNALLNWAMGSVTDRDLAGDMWDLGIEMGLKSVSKAVPVVGWIVAAGDLASDAVAAGQQAAEFVTGLVTLPPATEVAPLWWDALASDPARLAAYQDQVLRGWDYANSTIMNPAWAVGPLASVAQAQDAEMLTLSAGIASGATVPEAGAPVRATLYRALWPEASARAGWLIVRADWGAFGHEVCRYPVSIRWLTPQVGTPWCEDMQTFPQHAGYMRQYQWLLSEDGSELFERSAPDNWDLSILEESTADGGWDWNWGLVDGSYAQRAFAAEDGVPLVETIPLSGRAMWEGPGVLHVHAVDIGVTSQVPAEWLDQCSLHCD